LIIKIRNNKIGNEKKFTNVKLNGEKPNMVNPPSKKGARNITKNLLLSKEVKSKSPFIQLNLKFFFQFYSFLNNLYFLYDQNLKDVKNHESRLYQILKENYLY